MYGKRVLRQLVVATSVVGATAMVAATLPAQAAPPLPATHITASAQGTNVVSYVGTTVVVTGTVGPAGGLGAISLQLDQNGTWVTVDRLFTKGGAYTLKYVAPAKPSVADLRVSRAVTKTAAAGVSPTLHFRFVNKHFTVTANPANKVLGSGQRFFVSGKVLPGATGGVYLQRHLPDGSWTSVAKAALKRGGYYTLATTVHDGTFKYRVLRPYTATIAQGVSKSFTLVVSGPELTTTTLTAVVGQPYKGFLTAQNGTPPYEYDVSALPPGVNLLSAGGFFGRPETVGTTTMVVTVADANQHIATTTIQFVVTPVTVKAWGNNVNGEVGNGTTTATLPSPVATLAPGDVKTISAGDGFTLALLADGHVWSWGDNRNGQLGNGTFVSATTPAATALTNVISVAAGVNSGYAVKSDGTVWAWGDSADEQLGQPSTASVNTPVQVPGITTATSVSAGAQYALVLLADGTMVTFGSGHDGTLGNGTTPDMQAAPVPVYGHDFFLTDPVVAISAGWYDAYALLADGDAVAWGLESRGALADGDARVLGPHSTPVAIPDLFGLTQIDCHGASFCVALRNDGNVFTWGGNDDGELGNGTQGTDSFLPTAVHGLSGITQVAAGIGTSYALTSAGTVEAWGLNREGQIGNGTTTVATSPVAVPGLSGVLSISGGGLGAFAITSP